MESRIGFVILHYQTIRETIDCVTSIQKICDNKDIIIIVDNCSPNASGKILHKKYQQYSNIEVVLNKENLGFAKGNNVGFIEAKYQYKCDFVVLLNNDTIMIQQDFRNRLISAYEQYHFAVMGPKILQKDGTVNYCNPMIPIHTNLLRARIGQLSNYARYLLSVVGLDTLFSHLVDRGIMDIELSNQYQEDVQLAGCCWIFSKEYISKFDGINPDTFMYLEEILLYIRVKKARLKIIYNPELEIIHLEDTATLETFQGKTKKARQFKYRCQMESFKVLIHEINERV